MRNTICVLSPMEEMMESYFENCIKLEVYLNEEGYVFFNALDLGLVELINGENYWTCIHKDRLLEVK